MCGPDYVFVFRRINRREELEREIMKAKSKEKREVHLIADDVAGIMGISPAHERNVSD